MANDCNPEMPTQDPPWIARKKRRKQMPSEDIETEGEKLLKELSRKQLDTNVTLKGELSKKKSFTQSTVYTPVTAGISGVSTLDSYKSIKTKENKRNELRGYGLDEEEIALLLLKEYQDSELKNLYSSKKQIIDPLSIQVKLDAIEKKIEDKDKLLQIQHENFQGAKKMNRHEMDLEKAISGNRDNHGFLSILMTENKMENSVVDKSGLGMKQLLHDIEARLIGNQDSWESSSEMDINTHKTGINNRHLYKSTGCEDCDKLMLMDRYFVGPLLKSEYDYYDKCDKCKQLKYRQSEHTEQRKDTTAKRKKVPQKSMPCEVRKVDAIPKEVIKKYKLSIAQIKEISAFKEYDPGEPSKVLYLKNLSHKVTVEDLMSLFVHFQEDGEEKITIRLLTGKMRGQAFVHFPGKNTAKEAFNLVNGYDFKGKPIVIQYGRQAKE